MARISAQLVKELRERTGLGMMECKKALAANEGDIDLAIEDLRKNSGLKAAKKADRAAAEGKVFVATNGNTIFAVELTLKQISLLAILTSQVLLTRLLLKLLILKKLTLLQ